MNARAGFVEGLSHVARDMGSFVDAPAVAVAQSESNVMRQAHVFARRMGFEPYSREYREALIVCLEAAVKHFENPNPAPKHGWLCVTVYLDSNITAEAHFYLDSDDDIAEIQVWSKGQDLWPLLGEHAERDVRDQVNAALPSLLIQRERENEEERVGL